MGKTNLNVNGEPNRELLIADTEDKKKKNEKLLEQTMIDLKALENCGSGTDDTNQLHRDRTELLGQASRLTNSIKTCEEMIKRFKSGQILVSKT